MAFSHRKGQALLAYLALERARPQPRERLASLLWARTGDERARHNLRQALSKIRLLWPRLVESAGDRIAIDPAACVIDVVEFERLAQGHEIAELQAALELYRGELLEGYSPREAEYEDWLQLARGRLHKRACETAARLAAMLGAQDRVDEAIAALNRLLALDPANESAHRDLMKLLVRAGRRSEALRQYQQCAAALKRELDAEPAAETRRLLAELRHSGAASQAADDVPASVAPAGGARARDEDAPLPRKLAAILYADVARYSHLTGADEDATHRTLRRYLDLIAARVEAQRGRVAHYAGDAVLAQFDAAVDALACALTIQRELSAMNAELDEARQVRFRIGVNSGDVIEDRGDIYGTGVNVAARLEALAQPGGICISDAVRVAVGNRVAADYLFIGEQQVKNIAEPVRAYRVSEAGSRASGAAGAARARYARNLAPPGKPSLVIKPFANMSDDSAQDYFAEGLTKDISIALVKIPGIFLTMDESPAAERSRHMSVSELGREFGVRYVLTGGVRRHGERVRVNAELIDTASGHCLWAERYDRELHDLFTIQDEITEEIVTAMDVKLLRGEAARFLRKTLVNPAALDLAYRGWYALYHGGSPQDVRDAQHYFEELIRLEPDNPLGYASAAMAYWSEAGFGRVVRDSPAMDRAAELAARALELGDTTGFANMALALVHLANQEYEQAMEQATEGVTARPSCNGAYAIKSSILNYLGRPREAIEFAQYAVRLTPVYPAEFPAILAAAYHDSGRHEEAVEAARASLLLRPDDIDPLLIVAASSVALGKPDEARDAAARIRDLDPSFSLDAYAATQPYRDPGDLERLLERLRAAGLGD